MKQFVEFVLYTQDSGKTKILLQHRTKDAPTYPGKFGIFAGRIDDGETSKETVLRECQEELEYQLKDPKFILQKKIDSKYGKAKKFVFIERYDGSPLVLHEGQAMRWVSLVEAKELALVDHDREMIEEVFEIIKSMQ